MPVPASDRLSGRLLIAMPSMGDPRFERTVIYMCSHSEDGAMGLVVNRRAEGVSFRDLMDQLGIEIGPESQSGDIHFGGPVEMGRGFVLHSSDFHVEDATMRVDDAVSLTATLDVLRAMARGEGPRRAMIALGYSGWAPSQLESELQHNGWLTCDADEEILFSRDDAAKWEKALAKIGVSPSMLSGVGGTA
ncbi:MAG: YqgE/AlgH family protein [Rhodobacteraceae bacterium]|nr:MAG: YqgE/AlgH family protein [Paracoccaceae bacterium]